MKILVFSLGPIFPEIVHGGSQKVLCEVSKELGKRGHEICILCPKRDDNYETFELSHNAFVKPILPLRGTFPLPYNVSPYALARATKILMNHILEYDLLYIHDGGLSIELVKNLIPTVISLRDFCYPETLLGALNFKQSDIIVNSRYTYDCLLDSFANINPRIRESVHLIFNGYDTNLFRDNHPSSKFMKLLDSRIENNWKLIGFPHRPDMDKGFIESINVLEQLVENDKSVRMLIPYYMDRGYSERADKTYSELSQLVAEKDLEGYVINYQWIPHGLMPQFYSLCDAILCIGNFCESFSNVSVESLLCGTPVIATNSATYRTFPLRKYMEIVDFGDIKSTASCITELLSETNRLALDVKLRDAREYIIEHFSIAKCANSFEAVFSNALQKGVKHSEKRLPVNMLDRLTSECSVRLSSWSYYLGDKIYDDYHKQVFHDNLDGIFINQGILRVGDLLNMGIEMNRIYNAFDNGVLVMCHG